jgi:exodeoxyribonuclease V beta subunit
MSFDLFGPLPEGTVVLEASAGTGKTFTIAALATRYVAEAGIPLAELMLVTFGRAATQELRERTRQRLTSAAHGLDNVQNALTGDDDLVRHLAGGTPTDVAERRRRLYAALSEFDAATITTTHSFCQRMLDSLGIAGDREPGAEVVESVESVITETADDLYLATYAAHDAPRPLLGPATARQVAREAVFDRQAALAPSDQGPDTEAGQRVALATQARQEVARRKRVAGVRDFDDLLTLLRDALAHPEHGEASCARVRERYRVVLVDEFQDTDPVQWEVLRRAFHGHAALVLIGDPKQAIYAFRGAEVLSYLDAVRVAGRHETLGTNWRTDGDLITALDQVYGGAALGHPDIVVHPVTAAHPGRRRPGLGAPLRLRRLDRNDSGPLNSSGLPAVGPLRDRVTTDVADEIVTLLEGGQVRPGDIAVLVRTHRHSEAVREALDRARVPSVIAGSMSVFETRSATEWLWFLRAVEQPQRRGLVRLAALTALIGRRAEELDERVTTEVSLLLRELGRLFDSAGIAAVVERLAARTDLDARLLGQASGERRLTDIRHVAQLLNQEATTTSLGLSALVGWLAERVSDPGGAGGAERSRRLESDAAAVSIITVHTSKGLEFPVVFVPFGWDAIHIKDPRSLLLHDNTGQRVRDIGGDRSPGYALRRRRSEQEEAGDELRLLYVALTRAKSQLVLWWAPAYYTKTSPLHRLLFGRTPDSAEPELSVDVPSDSRVRQRFDELASADLAVEQVGSARQLRWTPPADHPPALAVARFHRDVDLLWRRTSYSALTRTVHEHPGVSSEPEEALTDEPAAVEPDAEAVPPPGNDGLTPSPMNGLPAGPVFGTLVHEVFELTDTSVPDLEAELRQRCREVVARRLATFDGDTLAAALLPVFRTPMLGTTLADVPTRNRLAEMDFELPLAGGEHPHAEKVTLLEVATLLRKYLPAGDPLFPYPDRLQAVEATPLRGYLTGSIDAVLRLGDERAPRYVIVDYKTNRLGRGDLTVGHYTRGAMAEEMLHAHYPLQALLYGVALHRYLRLRQPGYDPAQHLGGIAYLFVRGMVGPGTPAGTGVFDWQPPPGLVPELSDLLDGTA